MRDAIIRNLEQRMHCYSDLITDLDKAVLGVSLDVPKSKTIKDHLWCIVGARESYAKAIEAGEWCGFSCSMGSYERDDFAVALAGSAQAVLGVIARVTDWTPSRDDLLALLSEHEVMHEGQIIRHMYALRRTLPSSWRWA